MLHEEEGYFEKAARIRLTAKAKVVAVMTTEDNTSDIEALVMKSLSYKSPAPQEESELPRYDRPRKRTSTRSKKKLPEPNVELPSDTRKYTDNLAEVAKYTEERALRLALIGSRGQGKKHDAPPRALSNHSAVIQAPDIKEKAPQRRPRSQGTKSGEHSSSQTDVKDFVEKHRREVGRFGSSALHKRDRKTYETAELMKLGCRRPKNEKMPVGILAKKRKYQKIRERKKKEMDLATGMLVRTKRK